jgi:hypothetical protein
MAIEDCRIHRVAHSRVGVSAMYAEEKGCRSFATGRTGLGRPKPRAVTGVSPPTRRFATAPGNLRVRLRAKVGEPAGNRTSSKIEGAALEARALQGYVASSLSDEPHRQAGQGLTVMPAANVPLQKTTAHTAQSNRDRVGARETYSRSLSRLASSRFAQTSSSAVNVPDRRSGDGPPMYQDFHVAANASSITTV